MRRTKPLNVIEIAVSAWLLGLGAGLLVASVETLGQALLIGVAVFCSVGVLTREIQDTMRKYRQP